jgi:hypothetical protein
MNTEQHRALARIAIVLAAALVGSCGGSTDGGGSSGGSGGSGAGQGGSGNGPGQGGSGAVAGDAAAPGPVICAGIPCDDGHDCCLIDGKCFDPSLNAGACAPSTEPPKRGLNACNASSQCGPGEYCAPESLCLGPGFCQSLTNCGTSSGLPMCGCNGVTYPDVQTACGAGVAIIGYGECGKEQIVGAGGSSSGKKVTYCATNAMCPTGQECCSITGQCYDPSQPALCAFPPEGTSFPCVDDTQCFEGHEYCFADGCEGPGGCVSIPGTCDGLLEPVCGCNGKSYVNASCAAVDGVRVAHAGECSP